MRNRVRSLITIGGIALGVAVFLAISLANNTALGSFRNSVDKVAGKANLEIRPRAGRYMDESVLADLRWLWMTGARFSPVISADIVLADDEVVQLLGVDLMADDFYSDTAPSSGGKTIDFKKVFIGPGLSVSKGSGENKKILVKVDDRQIELQVADVLSSEGMGSAFSGQVIVCDIPLAQKILAQPGKISQISIIAPADLVNDIEAKLNSELPDNLRAKPPASRTSQIEKMTRSFEYNLWALTFIALMVGMFLIYNTIAISVIRRRVEIGTLATMGVTRGMIVSLLIGEASLLGLAGSLVGLVLGLVLADWSLKAVAETYQRLYFNIPLTQIDPDWRFLLLALSIGVILTVLASLPPALEGALISPMEATRRLSNELTTDRISLPLFIVAAILFLFAFYLSGLGPIAGFPFFGYLAALLDVFAMALSLPLILKLLLPPLALLLELLAGIEGKLAVLSLRRTLGRTSVAVATLALGIAMMISLSIMIGSFRQTVTDWAEQTLVSDLWMRPSARDGGSRSAGFPAAIEQSLHNIPGVKAVIPFTELPFEYNDQAAIIAGARFDLAGKYGSLNFVSGRNSNEVCSQVTGRKAIVSESFSLRHTVSPGDRIVVATTSGPLALQVVDIYYDYVSDSGYVVIPRDLFVQKMQDDSMTSIGIVLLPGHSPRDVRNTIFKTLGKQSSFSIRTTGELKQRILAIFDKTFAVTYALHTIAIAVAILSVMNALFALIVESRRDFGILKYIGMKVSSVKKLVLIEAGMLGFLGSAFGTALGFLLSLLLIYVINKQSFGWTIRYMIPFDFIIQSFFIVMATSILSGLVPARMAARTPAPEVVRSE